MLVMGAPKDRNEDWGKWGEGRVLGFRDKGERKDVSSRQAGRDARRTTSSAISDLCGARAAKGSGVGRTVRVAVESELDI